MNPPQQYLFFTSSFVSFALQCKLKHCPKLARIHVGLYCNTKEKRKRQYVKEPYLCQAWSQIWYHSILSWHFCYSLKDSNHYSIKTLWSFPIEKPQTFGLTVLENTSLLADIYFFLGPKEQIPRIYIVHPLLTKFFRSRCLDIGLVLFLQVYWPRFFLCP